MTGPTRRTRASARSTRFSARYAAKKTTRMTLRSSDGCPLNGPMVSVRREPLTSDPKTNVSARRTRPGGRPGVLVEPEPAVGPERDGHRRRHGQRHAQPQQLELAEPERPRAHVLDHEVLRQAFHQEQPDAAEEGGGRQDDLVEAAPRDHEDKVGDQQSARIQDQRQRVGGLEAPRADEPEGQAPDGERGQDREDQVQLAAPEPRSREPGQGRRARVCREARHGRPRSRRRRMSPTWISPP